MDLSRIMKSVILTGFEPFGPYKANPTVESTTFWHGKEIGGHDVIGIVLECTYGSAFEVLHEAIDKHQPTAVLCTGLCSRVQGIQIEMIGQNTMNGKYPDATGYSPKGIPIEEDGPQFVSTHCFATKLGDRLQAQGIPVRMSGDAEGFVCNTLLYKLARWTELSRTAMTSVFLHTPWTDQFEGKVKLEPGKIMLPHKTLITAIEQSMLELIEQQSTM